MRRLGAKIKRQAKPLGLLNVEAKGQIKWLSHNGTSTSKAVKTPMRTIEWHETQEKPMKTAGYMPGFQRKTFVC